MEWVVNVTAQLFQSGCTILYPIYIFINMQCGSVSLSGLDTIKVIWRVLLFCFVVL